MSKYQIKGDWIISENPFHSDDCMTISMKLSEVCIIKTEKEKYRNYFYPLTQAKKQYQYSTSFESDFTLPSALADGLYQFLQIALAPFQPYLIIN